jgi:23S rRNA (adenine2503-C2)-methyltransferase
MPGAGELVNPINLLDLTKEELQTFLAGWGEPRYRADQIWSWLYRRFAADPEEMTDLPASLRARLAAETRLDPLTPLARLDSSDGQTRKTLFALPAQGSLLGNGAQI